VGNGIGTVLTVLSSFKFQVIMVLSPRRFVNVRRLITRKKKAMGKPHCRSLVSVQARGVLLGALQWKGE
jgi:hypothetical protein